MCGIFAYIGNDNAVEQVLNGLQTLEYRGYDSAGIAYLDKKIVTIKNVGYVGELVKKVHTNSIPNKTMAIGHTRWSTHGKSTEVNSHPHVSHDGKIAVVHNGIIENYRELRTELEKNGIIFKSETDTETIPNLISVSDGNNLHEKVINACKSLVGSYAFLSVSLDEPETIVVAKNGNQPLVIGTTKDAVYMSSDTPTLMGRVDKIYALEDGEVYEIKRDFKTKKQPLSLSAKVTPATKGRYGTFMEKEIHEIPTVISNIEKRYANINLDSLREKIRNCETVHISACGTSYHAGLYIARLLENYEHKRVEVYVASELPHIRPVFTDRDIAIVISQSGETADTLMAMKVFKSNNLYTIAICNVEHSSIWRYADFALPTVAGTEVAVASTKAYIAQTLVGEVLVGKNFNGYTSVARGILSKSREIKTIATKYSDIDKIFFLGKGLTTITSLESALKVKEITYLHCEGISAGELKHGTLALVDDKTLSIILMPTDTEAAKKLENSIAEVKTRGSHIWIVPAVVSSLGIMYAQLFAFHLAIELGLDPDKPRNLAKSVTVE